MPQSTSLEATIGRLDRIIEDACTERSRLGIFPAMYRSVTIAVLNAIRSGGFFDDDEGVEHLTVVFADLYFDAYDRYRAGEESPRSWDKTFRVAESSETVMILQHLLLGMNAHINLDLGLAAYKARGQHLETVAGDFVRINEILFHVLDDLQGGLGEVSPRMAMLDRIGGQWDERLMRVGLRSCRDLAWSFACELRESGGDPVVVEARDADAAWVARAMLRWWSPVGLAARAVARVESRDVPQIVRSLGVVELDFDRVSRAAPFGLIESGSGGSRTLYQAAHRRPTRPHPIRSL